MKSQLTRTSSNSSFSNTEEDLSPAKSLFSSFESNTKLLAKKLALKVMLINQQWKRKTRSEIDSDKEQLEFLLRKTYANHNKIRQEKEKLETERRFLIEERLRQNKIKETIQRTELELKLSRDRIEEIKEVYRNLSSSVEKTAQKYADDLVILEEYEFAYLQIKKKLEILTDSKNGKLKVKDNIRQKIREFTIRNHVSTVELKEKGDFLFSKSSELEFMNTSSTERSKLAEKELSITEQRITEIQSRILASKVFPN